MRSVLSFLAGVVATVAAIVTVPMFWVSTHLADEDGYVAFSSTVATDGELQRAVAARLVDDYVQRGLIPAGLETTATSVLVGIAQSTTDEPGFVRAWDETQRSLHRSAFGDDTGPLTVPLQPLGRFVADRVGSALPVSLDVSTDVEAPVGTAADRRRLQPVERTRTYAPLGLIVVIAAAATCLVAARRRTWAIAGLGLGAVVTAGSLLAATEIVTPDLVDRAERLSPFARSVQKLLVEAAADSLDVWLGRIALGGAIALLVGLVGRLLSGMRRSELEPG